MIHPRNAALTASTATVLLSAATVLEKQASSTTLPARNFGKTPPNAAKRQAQATAEVPQHRGA